ncbi:hypothetical protein KAH55_11175, partial [bacterium]|nr:hypothetical protein [bacterium]
YTNLTLENITISGSYRTAFDIHGYDGLLLQNLTATSTGHGNGISITGCTTATVTGCTTSNNAWGGIAVYCSKSTYLNRPSSNVTIDMAANNIGEYVYVEDEFGLVNTNINVGSTTFSINNDYSPTANFTMYTDKLKGDALAYGVMLNTKFANLKSVVKETSTDDMFVALGLSIQEAIDACSIGNTVNVEAGIYTENIVINKYVKLAGVGQATVLRKMADAPIVTITGSGNSNTAQLTLKDLRIEPNKCFGIIFPDGAVSKYILFDDISVVGSPVAYTESEAGVWVRPTASVENWKVISSYFSESDYAFYFQKDVGGGSGSTVRNFTMNGTQLISNSHKGMYIEKLQDANFNNCLIKDNGLVNFWNGKWNAGIDINLKDGVYSQINFKDCIFSGNAKCFSEGAALLVKARDDGATYGAHPASLDNVLIETCDFFGNERGIRIGEPGKNNATPTNVMIVDCNIYNNINCSSGGSQYGDLIVQSQATVMARANWWGTPIAPQDVYGPAVACPWYDSAAHDNLNGPCLVRTAAFTADTTWGVGHLCVHFTNMSDNADSSYWQFGDGETSSETNPDHCYGTVQKYYTVKLTVFGDYGEPDSLEKVDYIAVSKPASANLDASPLAGVPGTEVQFVNNCGGNI